MSRKTKSIISGIVLVALIAGVLALAVSWLGKDTKSISSTEFAVGGINEQGNYVESKTSIYTKDMFECQGLTIEPDFEATGTYQVFYYSENKNFLGSTDVMNAEDGVYNKGETFAVAQYARVMITPDVPTDEDGNVEEDFKIHFYEVVSYANDYTITVNKKQKFVSASKNDLFAIAEARIDKMIENAQTVGSALLINDAGSMDTLGICEDVDVEYANTLTVVSELNNFDAWSYAFTDASGNVVSYGKMEGYTVTDGVASLVLDVPAGATTFAFTYRQGVDYGIYLGF